MFQEFPDDNLNSSFLSERRQKIAEESVFNIEERKNDLRRSKSVFIGAVSGLALAGIVGWFALSPRYAGETPTEIPTIRRPQTAVKVLPENPGGMEILNQDKSVYDIIDNTDTATAHVESILPPPEQPIMPEIKPAADSQPAPTTTAAQTQTIEEETVVASAPVKAPVEVKAVVNEEPEVKLPTIKEAAQKQAETALKAKPIKAAALPAFPLIKFAISPLPPCLLFLFMKNLTVSYYFLSSVMTSFKEEASPAIPTTAFSKTSAPGIAASSVRPCGPSSSSGGWDIPSSSDLTRCAAAGSTTATALG